MIVKNGETERQIDRQTDRQDTWHERMVILALVSGVEVVVVARLEILH
jgi:hypothetical protein